MLLAILIVVSLNCALALADLVVDARSARPRKRASSLMEIARVAVSAAERRGGPDKLRNATQCVLDLAQEQHIPCTAARADNLVHRALAENDG